LQVSAGSGAIGGLLLENEGCYILLDCRAVPVLSSSMAAPKQQLQQRQQQEQQQQQQPRPLVQLAVADYDEKLRGIQLYAVLTTSAWGLLGLAYLQQQLQAQGQELPIHTYCTEPCLHFYQQLSQELLGTAAAAQAEANAEATAHPTLQAQQQQQDVVPVPVLQQMAVLQQQVQQALHQNQQEQQQQQHPQQQQQHPQQTHQHHHHPQPLQPLSNQPGDAAQPPATATAEPTSDSSSSSSSGITHVPHFNAEQLQSVLDAVQIVRFGQRIQLPGWCDLVAEARPSGSGIGSCLWRLSCGDQRCASQTKTCNCSDLFVVVFASALVS
jgi:hypothetical protein